MANRQTFTSRSLFIFDVVPGLFNDLEDLIQNSSDAKEIVITFCHNINVAIQIGSIPYRLVYSGVVDRRFQQILTAERIRTIPDDDDKKATAEREAHRKADARMRSEVKDPKKVMSFAGQVLEILDRHLNDSNFNNASTELLRQITVMVWSAFEVLCNDIVRYRLNRNPLLFKEITSIKSFKDIFSQAKLIEILEANEFNISNRTGDVFSEYCHLDTIEKIKSALSTVARSPEIDIELKRPDIWRIAQQRNLIVHKRGIVDLSYVSKTGDSQTVGTPINLNSNDVEDQIKAICEVSLKILRILIL